MIWPFNRKKNDTLKVIIFTSRDMEKFILTQFVKQGEKYAFELCIQNMSAKGIVGCSKKLLMLIAGNIIKNYAPEHGIDIARYRDYYVTASEYLTLPVHLSKPVQYNTAMKKSVDEAYINYVTPLSKEPTLISDEVLRMRVPYREIVFDDPATDSNFNKYKALWAGDPPPRTTAPEPPNKGEILLISREEAESLVIMITHEEGTNFEPVPELDMSTMQMLSRAIRVDRQANKSPFRFDCWNTHSFRNMNGTRYDAHNHGGRLISVEKKCKDPNFIGTPVQKEDYLCSKFLWS